MAQEDSQAGQQVSDNIVSEFGTYQEFLDSQITRKDLFYLEVLHCKTVYLDTRPICVL